MGDEIFEKCFKILQKGETLMIFPEGSHDKKRTIRPLSKGFTRIISGAFEKYDDLEIQVVPVGITYQHLSSFPAKVLINYGKPIATKAIFTENGKAKAINLLKQKVSEQLQNLSVAIPDDENYEDTLQKLNDAQVDFTDVEKVNWRIRNQQFPAPKSAKKNYFKPLFYLIILNTFIPFLVWKKVEKKIDEIEFIDTFRFSLNAFLFPLNYALQAWIVSYCYGNTLGWFYFTLSAFLVFVFAKLAPVNAKKHITLN